MNFYFIRDRLLERGGTLNDGLPQSKIVALCNEYHVELSDVFRAMYEAFNGFPEGSSDPPSEIRIWPLESVLEEIRRRKSVHNIGFADFLIRSTDYCTDITISHCPVIDSENGIQVSTSVSAFLSDIVRGSHDFL